MACAATNPYASALPLVFPRLGQTARRETVGQIRNQFRVRSLASRRTSDRTV